MTVDPSGPVLIALCGATGTGKSTFINDASGSKLPVGHTQISCTEQVIFAKEFMLDGREIRLIDTPGFDDTNVSDTEILERIGTFLKLTHNEGQLLNGIIYMHRITDNRVGGVSRRNFRVFRELCGPKALENVLITTNMWHDPPEEAELAREDELKQSDLFFKPVLAKGARMARYIRSDGPESAHKIIRLLMRNTPKPTYLGEALADGVPLGDTNPGKVLNEEMQKLLDKQKAEIEELRREMQDAIQRRDKEHQEELAIERKQAQERLDAINRQMQSLNDQLGGERVAREEQAKRFHEENKRNREELARLEQDLTAARQESEANNKSAAMLEKINQLEQELRYRRRGFWGQIADAFGGLFS
ncbi:50S ribosome-binding GTPase [Ceratobasidium sp. AG-Ba]|nr:50S ribosome-binding GTPase [Ceratobasidium sp. AG-Ba]